MSQEYCDYLVDLLSTWGNVRAKRMFGGYGLYQNSQIFGLIANDTLYFKVDAVNKNDYTERLMEPFTYITKRGTKAAMSYREVPLDVIEDSDELPQWAQKALDAALRNVK